MQAHYLSDLNDEISEKNTQLFQQKEKIETVVNELKIANATKDKFFSIIAHDLKSPFNAIFGFSSLLKDNYYVFDDDEKKEFIDEIDNSSKNAYQLLENLLIWASSQQGKIEIKKEKTNLKQFILDAVSPYKSGAKKKKITFTNSVSENITVFIDKQTIKTVIANLFSNAVKFTPDKGHISINASTIDKFVEIRVCDNGVGISPNDIIRIFRIDESHTTLGTNNEKGTGLGLSLCKEFVEKNGGKIWVESKIGIGSEFIFTIPYIANTTLATNNVMPTAQLKNADKKIKILITEDDEVADKHLTILMRAISNEVIHAKNGNDAIEACRNNPDIDLVLMDIQMPKIDGYTATRKIRELNKHVVIIAQTACALSGDRKKAIEAGCNDYIMKPINKDELMKMINKWINDKKK